LRVLIAEGDTTNHQLGLDMLGKLGLSGQATATAAQTLSVLEAEHYDIALLDVQLPDLDSLSLARAIRQHVPAGQQPYLIGVTADALPGAREECLSAGMDDYLVKPLQIEALQAAIGRYYQQATAPQRADALAKVIGQPEQHADSARPASPPIDLAILEKMRALFGDQQPHKVDDPIGSFYADSAALLQGMHDAIAQANAHALQEAARQLKASSAVVAATALADLCNQFEQAIGITGPNAWLAWVRRIEDELAHVKLTLDRKRERIDE
jgi:CheY-like chemotaxis protein/HPt (histidine-containing phosphotransfer) domain-containing protein